MFFQLSIGFASLSAIFILVNVVFAILISLGATVLLIGFYGAYSQRRKLPAMLAIWVLEQAEQNPPSAFKAIGIGERNGKLIILVAAGQEDSVDVGERFISYNEASRSELGIIVSVEVDRDLCRCEIADEMGQTEFWEGLESRMTRDFGPPGGVTFLRQIDSEVIESAKRLLRSWGG